MAPLATAFVRLRADSTLLAADASRDASRAGDRAGMAMGRSMSSGLSRTFKAAAGIGVATGLVEAGRKVLDLADKFEGARASAEQNTENIGVAFASIEKPIGELDDKMAGLGFTITDTEGSFSQLVTATRDPAKAMRDVAMAADIARGRHISLNEATQILMRVETGHVAMLGRLGIATRNANGTIFTQQQAIDALGRAYGGNAAKFAGTFAGKQAVARAEMQKSATEIGVALLPAFVSLANVISHEVLPPIVSLTNFFNKHQRTLEPLVGTVLKLVLAWKAYNVAVKIAAGVSEAFGGLKAASGAASPLAASAASVARPLPVFVTNWNQIPGGGGGTPPVISTGGKGAPAPETGPSLPGGFGALPLAFVGASPDLAPPPNTPKDVQAMIPAAEKLVAAHTKILVATPALSAALAIVRARASSAATSTAQLTAAELRLSAASHRTADQLIAAAKKNVDLTGAQDALREAFQQAAQTAADNGRALSGNSDAALANRDAVGQEATAIFAVIDAMKQHGASASAQATELGILERALEINATKTYGDKDAVDALLRSLGLIPDAVSAAATALAALNQAQQDLLNSDTPSKGAILQLNAGVAKAKAEAATTGKKVAESFTAGYSPVVAKGVEKAAKTAADKAAAAFKAAKDKMLSDVGTIRDAIASSQQQIAGFADLSNNAARTDSLGASGPPLPVVSFLKDRAAKLKQFATLFTRLDRAGLDVHLLDQFAQVGPDAIPAMQQLLGRGQVRQANKLEGQILAYSRKTATELTALDQAGLIHDDLKHLPNKFADAFEQKLKKLHIITDGGKLDSRYGASVIAGST